MQKIEPRSSVASIKKLMSEANSELLLIFFKVTTRLANKIAPRIERKRDSIEFERSENQGQFLHLLLFKYILNLLNLLAWLESHVYQCFQLLTMRD